MRLWDYAVHVYGIDGVKDGLLTWQDDHGGDVNIALWCLWCGHEAIALSPTNVTEILQGSREITEGAVKPLRRARRYLSAPSADHDPQAFADLRRDALALELEAEKLVLNHLERATLDLQQKDRDSRGIEEIASNLFTIALNPMDMGEPIDDEGDPESPLRLFASILMLAKDHGP